IDGNRGARLGGTAAATCASGYNRRGFNGIARGDGNTFRYSGSIHAVCGTGMEWAGAHATISNSVFAANGDHNQDMMWSDGLTLTAADQSVIQNNLFVDNSDIDLILGGAAGSQVTGNTIVQLFQGSFGGLMLDNFNGNTTGYFEGAEIVGN